MDKKKRQSIINEITALMATHLYPFMGIYYVVLANRENISLVHRPPLDEEFRNAALHVIKKNLHVHDGIDNTPAFHMMFDLSSLCLPYLNLGHHDIHSKLVAAFDEINTKIRPLNAEVIGSGHSITIPVYAEKTQMSDAR